MTNQAVDQWSLYHSRLSFALNSKMLHPMQVIKAALETYQDSNQQIDITQVEGFIRQILGWREYVRGIYWGNMPNYRQINALNVHRQLPGFFWTGKTQMACMKAAINQSLDYAYAHHIQRLMVTGNFCLLTGIHPDEVEAWYLGIYIDAIEWVEMPNTRGMALYADHGIIATKPYAASGNYINKMSDYCKSCHYNVQQKKRETMPVRLIAYTGDSYTFMRKKTVKKNPRIRMIYRSWDQLSEHQRQEVLDRAQYCLDNLSSL